MSASQSAIFIDKGKQLVRNTYSSGGDILVVRFGFGGMDRVDDTRLVGVVVHLLGGFGRFASRCHT